MRFVFPFATLLLAGAALSACATAPDPAAVHTVSAFDAARISQDIKTLSDDSFEGRGIATPAEEKVIRYLSEGYAAAGFQPGGPNGRWTQDVILNRFTQSNVHASLKLGDWTLPLTQGREVAISTRRPAEHVSLNDAPLVFVGYGINAPERQWNDFKGQDLRGKILVVLVNDADFEEPALNTFGGKAMTYYGRWTYKYEEAAKQGAAGVLIVHETAPASYGWQTVANSWGVPQFDILRQNAAAERVPMEGWIQRDVAVDLFRRAGLDFEALKVQARSRDFQPVALTGASLSTAFDVATNQVTSHNVIARLPGTTHPDETVLYTAHWDHIGMGEPDATGDRIFNGAVDNASGTAGLLELARMFGQAPRTERSIVMISFTGEESGLLGSEYYAVNPVYPLAKTVGGFNMDSMNVYGRVMGLGVTGYGQVRLRRASGDGDPAAGSPPWFPTTRMRPAPITVRTISRWPNAGCRWPMPAAGAISAMHRSPSARRRGRNTAPNAITRRRTNGRRIGDYRGMIEDLTVFYDVGRALADSRDWPQWKPGSEFAPVRATTASERR